MVPLFRPRHHQWASPRETWRPHPLPSANAAETAGGIWALKPANDTDLRKNGMGQLKNAFTMEEISMMIEALGGKFYRDPNTYWALQEQHLWSGMYRTF